MKIFISGLGMNGKSTFLSEMQKLGYEIYGTDHKMSDLLRAEDQRVDSVPDMMTDFKFHRFMNLKDKSGVVLCDRSFLDQVCIASNMDASYYDEVDYDRLMTKFASSISEDDVFVLIESSSDLINKIFDDNISYEKKWLYSTPEDYLNYQNYFLKKYEELIDKYLPKNKLVKFYLKSFTGYGLLKNYINEVTKYNNKNL